MKRLLTFLTLLMLFFTTGWAATVTLNAIKVTNANTTWTDSGGNEWDVTVDGGALDQNVNSGYAQIGTRTNPSTSVTLSTSGITGTISKIVIDCASYNGLATVSATVGGNAFGTQNQSTPSWSNNSGDNVTFSGSASGEIVITMTNGTGGRAMYIKSVTVTYGSSAQTYTISYGNPSGGTISGPTSSAANEEVTLTATPDHGYQFGSWNVKDASNNTVTVTNNKFTMPASNVTVNATFTTLPTYAISVTNGAADPTAAYEGQTVTLSPTIPDGKVVDWDNTTVSPSTLVINHSDYTFTMPGEAVSVAFAFKDAPIGQTATYIFNTVEGIEALGLTAPSSGGTNLSEDDTYDSGDVTMTTTHGSTNTRIWYNSSTGYDLRVYGSSDNHPAAGTLTFTVPSGCVITQMDFTYGSTFNGFTVNTGEFNSNYSTWTGSAQSVTLTSTYGQNQIKTITIYYSSTSVQTTDLYIVGQVNGLSGWSATKAVKMTYDGTKYTAKFYVTGNTTNEMGVNAGTFVFATKIGSWGDVNGNRYEPPFADEEGGDKNWWLATTSATNSGALYKKNYNNSFLIPAGLYEVEVDANISTFNLKTIKDLTPTIDPEGGEVVLNTTVTASISENFNTFISSCNAFEGTDNNVSVVTPEVKFYVNNEEEATLSKEVTLDAVGETTVTGKCALVSGNTEYTYETKSETYDVYQPYTVTIAGGITGGTVSASPRNNVREGTTVRVFPTPSANYELTSLTYTVEGNSTAVDITMTGDEYSFAMPAGNVTINATFTYNGPVATSMTFSRITSTDDLVAGEKYLIVNEDAGKALQFNGSSSTASDITITNNQTTILETDAAILTLGESNGVYTFATGSGYVANTSSTNIVLDESSDKWTVTFSGDNNAVIHHTLVSTDRYVRYINNNFKAYASNNNYNNSSPVQLYKETTPSLQAPVITPGSMIMTDEFDATITCATEGATIYYTLDGTTPTTNSAVYNGPITIERPPVTLNAIAVLDGQQSAMATAEYSGVWVYNIAEYNELAKGTENIVFKNPVTVQYHYISSSGKSYIYVKDDSGCAYFHQPAVNGATAVDQLENGDIIAAGFYGNKVEDEMVGDEESNFFMLTNLVNFAPNGDKGLADPEHETVAHIADATTGVALNNHYITIKKVKLSALYQPSTITYGGAKYFDIDNVAHIGYNKFNIDYNTVVDDLDAYYNITGIQTAYNNVMEFHPTEIVKWEETVVTLRQLCDEGVTTDGENEYTISNNLMCVYANGNSIWVKDDTGQSICMTSPEDGDENFEVFAEAADGVAANTRLNQAYYDQSNWCEIKLANDNDTEASAFVGQIIKGGSIQGNFTNKLNPTLENVYLAPKDISSEGSYAPNYYMPANFMGSQDCGNNSHNDYEHTYFFMNPKPQEYAQIVWAVWSSQDKKFIMSTSTSDNAHRFEGAFSISFDLNTGASSYSQLTNGYGYNFKAILRMTSSKANGYMVYPLDLDEGIDPTTSINTVNSGNGMVKSVKYVNVAGIVSDVPFQGINIVVTEYTDGSRSTTKMLRK